jgi:glycine/betaine/sarcosine/D-proline reductase family selenoprotein B
MLRVGHYVNQFFAGVGGEEHANHPPEVRDGPLGPGRALQTLLKEDGRVVSTLFCGDNYFNEQAEAARSAVRAWLYEIRPDAVLAGPAFAAGRYGSACAEACRLSEELGVPAVTGLHPENPGLLVYKQAYVIPTGDSATGMVPALTAMLALVKKRAARLPLAPAEVEGHLPRGIRRPGLRDRSGAERAVAMLIAKLRGAPFRTEVPVNKYEAVPPAASIPEMRRARIAVVTTGGIVPKGNPDHIKRCSETRWKQYDLTGLDAVSPERFECVHGGFFNLPACENPHFVLPLDALRVLEREGAFGELMNFFCSTVGNDQRLAACKRHGAEIAALLRSHQVNGALLVAT